MDEKKYKKFRQFTTAAGKRVIAGKNAEQNEEVADLAEKNEIVLHTKLPGSPFCVIKGEADKSDIAETAVFCSKYSQAWKKAKVKRDVEVHVFLGKDIFKTPDMKLGTFGVKKFKTIIARKSDIEK